MFKSLVIVESPAKAKTINKFLGKYYTVKASIGHIKDLPKTKLGVDIENDFEPHYVVIKGKGRVVSDLKKTAQGVERIYLATDPDREGEAIAWHIAGILDGDKKDIYRVLFNEITEKAVLEAIKNPGRLDRNKYEAHKTRRIMDRLVGYEISPLLWKKVRRGLSAGRVQSVAVRLICEREREIKAFIPEEYWSITAEVKGQGAEVSFKAKLAKKDNKKVEIKNEEQAGRILNDLEGARFVVSNIEKKERRKNPSPPFITSKLQQEAVRRLGFTAKKTMLLAQQLYEGVELGKEGPVGIITYMRTDSTRVSPTAIEEARDYITKRFGKEHLPPKPNLYPSKKGAQDAHEAIRPTYLKYTPEFVKGYLTKDLFSLYQLIWNRFIACQMNPCILDQTTVQIEARPSGRPGTYLFQSTGSVVKFQGFTAVYIEAGGEEEEEGTALPALNIGEILRVLGLLPQQHFTQPPPRFTEATLVKELEEKGIGRPSTYATIISTIQERDYVKKEKGYFIPTDLGLLVTDMLVKSFPHILDVRFTAHMEEELDKIEDGKLLWLETMREFYGPFKKSLGKAHVEMQDIKREEVPTTILCEVCARPMVIKWGRRGKFLSCSAYPTCKNTKEFTIDEKGNIQVATRETSREVCPNCGKAMIIKTGRFGRFLACSSYPECKTTKPLSLSVNCPVEGCGGVLVERWSKTKRRFYGCSNYPGCTFAIWDRPLPESCPMCGYTFLVEEYKKGERFIRCPKEGCEYKIQRQEAIGERQ
ncbi:MAG: type I DNA topoisomerase [Deltaproteobacteria bacterium]|nr:type I DNA topoisomerase [Deltaproteobacteria bacterium]